MLVALASIASGAATAELTRAASREAPSSDASAEGIEPLEGLRDAFATPEAQTPPSDEAPAPPRVSGHAHTDDAPTIPRLASADAASSNLRGGRVITGETSHRLILFTFDDGPDARYTRALLDELDEADVRAVFFLTTRRFAGSTPYERNLASIAREIAARGHHVGTHTMDHIQLPLVSTPELGLQVDASADLVLRELGSRPALLRPPGGSRSPRINGYLAARGYTQVLWNLGTGDVQVRSADAVLATFRRVLEARERERGDRGGIVLLHDIHAWSVEAFPRIVAFLDRRNCDLLAAGEELYDFVDDPALFFDARVEGDPNDAVARIEPPAELLAIRQLRARARAEARCGEPERLDAIAAGRASNRRAEPR